MSKTFEKILLLSSISVMVLGYNLKSFLWKNAFYHCMAAGVLLSYLMIKILCENRKDLINIADVCFFLAVSNFLDELFFNPTAFGINEYLVAVTIIIWQWKIHKKKLRQRL